MSIKTLEGKLYFTLGINEDCEKVITATTLVRMLSKEEMLQYPDYDCITKSEFEMFDNTKALFKSPEELKKHLKIDRK